MVNPIPRGVRRAWERWNIRGCIIFSLSLQTILILFAPSRKRTGRKIIIMMIWSGYLLADAVANFAVGLISNSQKDNDSRSAAARENSDLLAFWAPFLLLHLGGPDTITAFALEDNALWLRHLLALVVQVVATLYVFVQTLPKNKVIIPTILLFFAGIIKYLERTRSLYLASIDKFRDSMLKPPDAGPNYAKLMEEYASMKEARLPTRIIYMPEPEKEIKDPIIVKTELKDIELVQKAYRWFNLFKGLVVDLIFSFKERNESRDFFDTLLPTDALRMVEVELNFFYEVLFTKVVVVHSNWGRICRLIAFCAVASALGVFRFHVKKHGYYNMFDVTITYALLMGAIALDIIAFFMAVFSDWTVTSLQKSDIVPDSGWKSFTAFLAEKSEPLFKKFLKFKRQCQFDYPTEKPIKHNVIYTPFAFRRWSHFVSTHNLIRYCLKGRPEGLYKYRRQNLLTTAIEFFRFNLVIDPIVYFINKLVQFVVKCISVLLRPIMMVIQFLHINTTLGRWTGKLIELIGLKDLVDEILYVGREPFTRELWDFIFHELLEKSQFAVDRETTKRICLARGDWVLQNSDWVQPNDSQDRDSEKNPTLMPYILDVSYDESLLLWHVATELLYNEEQKKENPLPGGQNQFFSKLLSDYMIYLLIIQPTMMAAVAGVGKIRFRDTCAETNRFFERKKQERPCHKDACRQILEVNTEVRPIEVKGDRSKSVLFDACRLAKELRKLNGKKWELISRVWVELLSYAASHCRATAHAQQVSKGGELLSLIWLVMAHFGIGDQFQINEGHARAKLIVGK